MTDRAYPVMSGGKRKPPDHQRVARALSDGDLEDELRLGKGGDEYQAALLDEARRRGLR